jgi:hypothetical protein
VIGNSDASAPCRTGSCSQLCRTRARNAPYVTAAAAAAACAAVNFTEAASAGRPGAGRGHCSSTSLQCCCSLRAPSYERVGSPRDYKAPLDRRPERTLGGALAALYTYQGISSGVPAGTPDSSMGGPGSRPRAHGSRPCTARSTRMPLHAPSHTTQYPHPHPHPHDAGRGQGGCGAPAEGYTGATRRRPPGGSCRRPLGPPAQPQQPRCRRRRRRPLPLARARLTPASRPPPWRRRAP